MSTVAASGAVFTEVSRLSSGSAPATGHAASLASTGEAVLTAEYAIDLVFCEARELFGEAQP
jgi:hypothetical protein